MKIGVIGSMQHTKKMLALCHELEQFGHESFITKFAASMADKDGAEIETMKLHQKNNLDAIREFWRLMQGADAVLVANYDKHGEKNYIGGNTFMEMGFAHVLRQKIFLLNPAPDNPYYRTEIEAMRPVVLNGDLSKINSAKEGSGDNL